MRPATSLRRASTLGLASLGLAALVATSACQPISAVNNAASGGSPSTATQTTPWTVRTATPHAVAAPALGAYPWAGDQTGGLDPYGMTKRQCVSYAAWYLNAHGTPFGYRTQGPKGIGTFGNASSWDSAAKQAGFTVSTKPVAGAIAQWHANESKTWTYPGGWSRMTAGPYGHVAVVTAVNPDGSVAIAQYNMGGTRSLSTMKHIYAPRYLYIPLNSPRVR